MEVVMPRLSRRWCGTDRHSNIRTDTEVGVVFRRSLTRSFPLLEPYLTEPWVSVEQDPALGMRRFIQPRLMRPHLHEQITRAKDLDHFFRRHSVIPVLFIDEAEPVCQSKMIE